MPYRFKIYITLGFISLMSFHFSRLYVYFIFCFSFRPVICIKFSLCLLFLDPCFAKVCEINERCVALWNDKSKCGKYIALNIIIDVFAAVIVFLLCPESSMVYKLCRICTCIYLS